MSHAGHAPRLAVTTVTMALVGLLGACSAGPGSTAPGTGGPVGAGRSTSPPPALSPTTTAAPSVVLTPSVSPQSPVPVDTVVSVAASNGTVSDVVLTHQDPRKGDVNVEGALDPAGTT